MNKIFDFGHGYRTYLSAVIMLVIAGYGAYTGDMDTVTIEMIVANALAVFGLRKAIK